MKETSDQFLADLIRREFDRVRSRELKLECIAAAEYYGLNDLADDMEYDLEIN